MCQDEKPLEIVLLYCDPEIEKLLAMWNSPKFDALREETERNIVKAIQNAIR